MLDRDEPNQEDRLFEQEVALQWKRYAAQTTFHRRLLEVDPFTIEVVFNTIFDGLCVQMEKYILTDDFCDEYQQVTHKFDFPTSAWQHFKMQYAGNWFMRKFVDRWPVKWGTSTSRQEIRLKTSAVFPDNRMYPENFGKPVIVRSLKLDSMDG